MPYKDPDVQRQAQHEHYEVNKRLYYLRSRNRKRAAAGRPPLTEPLPQVRKPGVSRVKRSYA